jgi:hypothetical protein
MLIDTFSYFNENELLELRIRLLYDYVDKFIICEGDHTHRGIYKGFKLQEVLDNLKLPQEKVQVVKVFMPSYQEQPDAWVRERMQRDAAAPYIKSDDICIVGDLDEIPDPAKLTLYTQTLQDFPNKNTLLYFLMHNLQQRADRELLENGLTKRWQASYICTGSQLRKHTPSQYRESLTTGIVLPGMGFHYVYEPNKDPVAGWHFSWMGDKHTKLKNFAHWDEFDSIHETQDILGRPDHSLIEFDTTLLPEILEQLPHIKNFLLG